MSMLGLIYDELFEEIFPQTPFLIIAQYPSTATSRSISIIKVPMAINSLKLNLTLTSF